MAKTYYMHTLDGQPAFFYDGLICFMTQHGKASPLATSLKQIRREQAACKSTVADWPNHDFDEYSYRRVTVPEPDGGK